MATYQELFNYISTPEYQDLVNKITVAVAVKAQAIAEEATPTAESIAWAASALGNPRSVADAVINYVIAANAGLTTTQISNASDAAIQTNVDTAVDKLFGV